MNFAARSNVKVIAEDEGPWLCSLDLQVGGYSFGDHLSYHL